MHRHVPMQVQSIRWQSFLLPLAVALALTAAAAIASVRAAPQDVDAQTPRAALPKL